MDNSIYDYHYTPSKIEHVIPFEIENMYVDAYGTEPSKRILMIFTKLWKR